MTGRSAQYFKSNAGTLVLVAYLGLCLVFGGSGLDGRFAHGVLQAIAAFGIARLVILWPEQADLRGTKMPLILIGAFGVIGGLHVLPIPFELWLSLPGRGAIEEGRAALGLPADALATSVDFEATLRALSYLLIPTFVILLSLRIKTRTLTRTIPWFFSVAAIGQTMLGLMQLFLGDDSQLYLFEFTNKGVPVGTFANANHFACFLLICLPFMVFVLNENLRKWRDNDLGFALAIVGVGGLVLLLVGIFAAGSLAIYLMLIPVAALSLIVSNASSRKRGTYFQSVVLLGSLAAGAILAWTSPLLNDFGHSDFSDGSLTRRDIWTTSMDAVSEFWPIGSGMGTYQSVIPLFEDHDAVTSVYIARAHNEYLQVTVEAGILGLLVLTVGLGWFFYRGWRIWMREHASRNSILQKLVFVSLTVVILHSALDYPTRTPAISAVVALMVAMVAFSNRKPDPPSPVDASDPRRLVL